MGNVIDYSLVHNGPSMKQPVLVLLLALAIPFCQAVAVKTGGDQSPYDFDGTYPALADSQRI